VRNFLLGHIFAIQIAVAALEIRGAADFSWQIAILIITSGLVPIAAWALRSPHPPSPTKALQREAQPISGKGHSKPRVPYISPYVVTFDDQGVVVDIGGEKRDPSCGPT
jgi:hypothetical protein